MSDIDKAVELSLRTWYPKDHELHLNPHHPLGKLVGKWGELLGDYMKSLYKPGYKSDPLNELGDIWYYLRILAYQSKHVFELNTYTFEDKSIEYLICLAIEEAAKGFQHLEYYGFYSIDILNWSYSVLLELLGRFNLTLDQLTESNWKKLKPGSERGEQWERARTEYVGGKITIGD